ncbi:MFS transporter [Streptomyces sp. cmx-10-25]|uniref:MFS transporter n=1 Tax=Streptomyces sp. cmx-10-25 TaxID=2790919 RepID=UPI00397FD838
MVQEPPGDQRSRKTGGAVRDDATSLWQHHDFLRLWLGRGVTQLGTAITDFALPILVLSLTNSPSRAGLLAALERLPYLLLAIPAGVLVDRWNRRTVMLVCGLMRGVCIGMFGIYLMMGGEDLSVLTAILLISGAFYVFHSVADNAILPQLVPRRALVRASGWMEGTTSVVDLAGPALAGVVIALSTVTVGVGYAYGIDALSYGVAAVAVSLIRTPMASTTPEKSESLARSARIGMSFLWRNPVLRSLALTNLANCVLLAPLGILFITFARSFGMNPAETGRLLALGIAGGVLGSIATAPLERRLGPAGVLFLSGMAWALGNLLFAFSPGMAVVVGACGIISFVMPLYFSTLYAYRNSIIPDNLRGRVNSMYRLIAQLAGPIGLSAGGALIGLFGTRAVGGVTAVIFLLVTLAFQLTGGRRMRYAAARSSY